MTETVRFVSDGEELVTQQGTNSLHVGAEAHRPPPPAAARLSIQYRGFRDADGRREYMLSARGGAEERTYTLSIALTAFAERRARLQDGPDICYRKLVASFEGSSPSSAAMRVTDEELAAYRASHPLPVPRAVAALPPAAAAAIVRPDPK
jgi:hypothetical protein